MSFHLPTIPALSTIQERLPIIFPEGTENRVFVTRDMAAKTIFIMFYVGAIEGNDIWIRPDQVTRMTDDQAAKVDATSREQWARASLAPGKMKNISGRWYAANTREPIRDETLRMGLVLTGAVVVRQGLATTSAKPRYALNREFAALFDEDLTPEHFNTAAIQWQENHLSPAALARVRLRSRGARAADESGYVLVRFPNGEGRQMSPGPSSVLSQGVIEDFAPRFLKEPAVVFLSESGNKIISEDQRLAHSLGLRIEADRTLPDIILADIGAEPPLLVFVEVVITDGPITQSRRKDLLESALGTGFPSESLVFVSAFEDRSLPVYRRLAGTLAWGSMVWFATEPDHLIWLIGERIKIDHLPAAHRKIGFPNGHHRSSDSGPSFGPPANRSSSSS